MKSTITFRIRLAWWLRPYLYGIAFVSRLTGTYPDMDKIRRRVYRAIRVGTAKKHRITSWVVNHL